MVSLESERLSVAKSNYMTDKPFPLLTAKAISETDAAFIYIIGGKGKAEIGDELVEVKAGGFMAFTRNSLPHCMHNSSAEDLFYLSQVDDI